MSIATDSVTRPTAQQPWDIDAIVAELRALRNASLEHRQRLGRPLKLPSRTTLAGVLESLGAALFPNRLGSRELDDDNVDYFVGRTLDSTLQTLVGQIVRELRFGATNDRPQSEMEFRAIGIVREFAGRLAEIRVLLETDIHAAYMADPAARSIDEVLACYPGVTAITHYRIAHVLYELGTPLVARIISEIAHSMTGIDIHPGARIGRSFFIDHGTGVVIGETAIIGQRVRLFHGVTLGAKTCPIADRQRSVATTARHPVVEDDVVIYAGATLLGPIRIGKGATIGGNVWLTQSVPPDTTVSQADHHSAEFMSGDGI